MARHKHKNPRVKVFFRYRGRCFRLLEAINFGTKTAPELKIKGLAETYMQTKDDQHRFDGHFHVGQLIRFKRSGDVKIRGRFFDPFLIKGLKYPVRNKSH